MAGRSRRTSGCSGAGADMCSSFNQRRRAGPVNRGVRTRLRRAVAAGASVTRGGHQPQRTVGTNRDYARAKGHREGICYFRSFSGGSGPACPNAED